MRDPDLKRVGAALARADIGLLLATPRGDLLYANPPLRAAAGDSGADAAISDLLEGDWIRTGDGGAPAWPPSGHPVDVTLRGPAGGLRLLLIASRTGAEILALTLPHPAVPAGAFERLDKEIYLEQAVRDSADAIVSLDEAGCIRFWNDGARQMFGWGEEEVRGRRYRDLLVPEAEREAGDIERMDEMIAREGFVRGYETRRRTRDGRLLPVEVTVTRLYDAEGRPAGRSVIYRDISERIRLESELRSTVGELQEANRNTRRNQERLIALEKLSAIGEMSARVAHEIRTPLVTIGGFAATLIRETPEDAPARRYLEIIGEEVRRLETIVAEILEYVRPARQGVEPCDVNAVLLEALRPFEGEAAERGVLVDLRLAGDLPAAQVDRYQIHQVFANLIQNAIQAMSEGGVLTVGTEDRGSHVCITVADTGVGIPERNRQRIFRAFFTTKATGSGLGLAIAAQIVAQNHGTITFESAEGRGTCFEVRLPAGREPTT